MYDFRFRQQCVCVQVCVYTAHNASELSLRVIKRLPNDPLGQHRGLAPLNTSRILSPDSKQGAKTLCVEQQTIGFFILFSLYHIYESVMNGTGDMQWRAVEFVACVHLSSVAVFPQVNMDYINNSCWFGYLMWLFFLLGTDFVLCAEQLGILLSLVVTILTQKRVVCTVP